MAFVLISPQGRGALLDESSWKGMTRPAVVVTGSNDLGRSGQPVKWRLDPFHLSPGQDKYLLFVDGAHHGFGGITGTRGYRNAGAANPNHLAYVQSVTTAFWDEHLKMEKAATSFLDSKRIAELSEGEARLERRNSR
jgi:hypothetical protein